MTKPFTLLFGHAAALVNRIGAAAVIANDHLDADPGSREHGLYLATLSMEQKITAQLAAYPQVSSILRKHAVTPPAGSLRDARVMYDGLDDKQQDALVAFVEGALLRWSLFAEIRDSLVGTDEVEDKLVRDGQAAYSLLLGLRCLISGASPREVQEHLSTIVTSVADAFLSPVCSDQEPEGDLAWKELLTRRVVLIDLAELDANPSRGELEASLALLAAGVASSEQGSDPWRPVLKAIIVQVAQAAPWRPASVPTRAISMKSAAEPVLRRAVRILSMVSELHKAGYQLIRISPGLSPSGAYWRCSITDAYNIASNGWEIVDFDTDAGRVAAYTSAMEDAPFDWQDAPGMSARQLAARFLTAFPRIAATGAGRDWLYAGWLLDVLGRAEQGRSDDLPIFYSDMGPPVQARWLPPPPPLNQTA